MAPPPSFSAQRPSPAIFISSLDDARAALAAAADLGCSPDLWISEDSAAGYGAAIIGRMFALARREYPDVAFRSCVDCGDAPGLALALLRRGIERLHLTGSEALLARVASIAADTGADLAPRPDRALDLHGVEAPKKACATWLQRFPTRGISPHHNE